MPASDGRSQPQPRAGGARTRGYRLYGVLDLAFAGGYAWLGFGVARGRSVAFDAALAGVVLLLAAAGVSLLVGARWARPVALVAAGALLAFAATVVALLVASAAYLRGIYGPLGEGVSLLTLVAAALVVELCGLLPLFQLRMLLRDGGGRDLRAGAGDAGAR